MKKAIITGITGQDGAYLAEHLLSKDYEVYGIERRVSTHNRWRIKHIEGHIKLLQGDLMDQHSLTDIVESVKPDEVYNLAAQSSVPVSWKQPILTGECTALGVTRVLEAVRMGCPTAKVYQASSSELFGKVQETPQTEKTLFYPRSPYGVAKLYGHWITVNYRESYGLHTSSGIMFNHESPLRGLEFVTRKITHTVARIATGQVSCLELGNLGAKRDWGYAGDYVKAMWLMLQKDTPDDYVIATGKTHSVRGFCTLAFESAGIEIVWCGDGVDEKGIDKNTGRTIVRVNPEYYRPAEVDLLIGDPTKAREELGWEPEVSFYGLINMMVEADLKLCKESKA